MIKEWFNLSDDRRKEIFTQTAQREGLPVSPVEKDWWVTLIIKTVFELDFSEHFVFKGGTSLSKGWNLIKRFSEDVDLVIDMTYLDFDGDPSPQKITKLRKKSHKFVRDTLSEALDAKLKEQGAEDYELSAKEEPNTTTDPHSLLIVYKSIVEKSDYVSPMVRLEVGGRSQMEPSEITYIQSLVGKNFSDKPFSDKPFPISTVVPKRTFLEKAFLLHEEFSKPGKEIISYRMSRHLYDLEKIMDTDHGKDALADKVLYNGLVKHRSIFLSISGMDYESHLTDKIDFIPPEEVFDDYKNDYKDMQESMIYGDSLAFDALIDRVTKLRNRFRKNNRVSVLNKLWKFLWSLFNRQTQKNVN